MASFVAFVLLVSMLASSARSGSSGGASVMDLIEVMKNFEVATAIFSTIDDPNQKCLVAKRGDFDLQTSSTNFTWYYQGLNGSPKTKCFYNEIDKPTSDVFYMAPCDDPKSLEEAHALYTDNKYCFIGQFPPITGDQCMLWVTPDAKDSVPQQCEEEFREKCKGEQYVLYDKESCQ